MEMKLDMTGGIAAADQTASAAKAAPLRRDRVLPEQMAYADLLDMGMKIGLAMLVVTFSIYVLGVVEPHVPLADMPAYWSLPVAKYLELTGVGIGWNWLKLAHKGDFMNFLGIAFLSAVTIVCYLRVLPYSLRARDVVFSIILVLEVVVLSLGASGILAAGH